MKENRSLNWRWNTRVVEWRPLKEKRLLAWWACGIGGTAFHPFKPSVSVAEFFRQIPICIFFVFGSASTSPLSQSLRSLQAWRRHYHGGYSPGVSPAQ